MKKTTKQLAIVKLGSNVLTCAQAVKSVSCELETLHTMGFATILVHGGGALIDEKLNSLGIPVQKKHGLRVTDAQTIGVVQQVLDAVNETLCAEFESHGISIKPFTSASGLLQAEQYIGEDAEGAKLDLGYVGTVASIDLSSLNTAIDQGTTPLLVPMGFDGNKQVFNINADDAAAAVAIACHADALLFLCDVPGVLVAAKSSGTKDLVPVIKTQQWQELLEQGTINGGMIPKLQTAFTAAGSGVTSVQIIDGTEPDCILKAITQPGSTGTLIAA